MNVVAARFASWVSSYLRMSEKRAPQTDSVEIEPRPMTGLWQALTPEQKARAKAYSGDETHGDPHFASKT
jgi:hypothetical protein